MLQLHGRKAFDGRKILEEACQVLKVSPVISMALLLLGAPLSTCGKDVYLKNKEMEIRTRMEVV